MPNVSQLAADGQRRMSPDAASLKGVQLSLVS